MCLLLSKQLRFEYSRHRFQVSADESRRLSIKRFYKTSPSFFKTHSLEQRGTVQHKKQVIYNRAQSFLKILSLNFVWNTKLFKNQIQKDIFEENV